MKKILWALLSVILWACTDGDSYRVSGELDDNAEINLRLIFYSEDGITTGLTASHAGKFQFEGRSRRPAIIEIYDNDYRLIGRVVAQNGQHINTVLSRKNPYNSKAKGNDLSQEMSELFNAHAEALQAMNAREKNAFIADYIGEHPQSQLGVVLLLTEYDASGENALGADSLRSLLGHETGLEHLSALRDMHLGRLVSAESHIKIEPIKYALTVNKRETFIPARQKLSLIVFRTNDNKEERDSILPALRSLARHEQKGQFAIMDFSLDTDTLTFVRIAENDSATWHQGWLCGGVGAEGIDELGISALPYFVLADSAGYQLWRGTSLTEAKSMTIQHLP